jgi:Kef-type K+ transport system membrane component KefB
MGVFESIMAWFLISIVVGSSLEKQKANANQNQVNENLQFILQMAVILGIVLFPVIVFTLLSFINQTFNLKW